MIAPRIAHQPEDCLTQSLPAPPLPAAAFEIAR